MGFLQMQTTFEKRAEAAQVARALVERELAACVQLVGPIQSIYRWQEQIETTEEWLCLIKTDREHYSEVKQAIEELHPYEVPEIIALPITVGSEKYLAWLQQQLTPPK